MNVNDMTFGCEFEIVLPASVNIRVGGYHSGIQVAGLPDGWNAQGDGSIRSRRGWQAVEIVSPVLKGADGINQVRQVCQWFRSVGARVNQSCGFHVHVGWNGDDAALGRLVHLVSANEKALYAATGTKNRERGNYCRPIQNDSAFVGRFVQGNERSYTNRYHSLNITNLSAASKRTVELRVFSGTVNAQKAVAYIRLALGMVQKASMMKRLTKWTPKATSPTSPIFRKGGEGQTALTRLFYSLGWTKGRESFAYGNIEADGAPSIADTKKTLTQLARKYDGPRPSAPNQDAAN